MVNVGVIGCGHWGPNHIRIFSHLSNSKAVMAADTDETRRSAIGESFPGIKVTADYKEILNNRDVAAVCIASPTNTHYKITREALISGKHVLCEKPLALTVEECDELTRLAAEKKKVLMVGHVFIFNSGIVWLKDYIQSGELGKIHYAYSTRTNLGPFRYDVNAFWDLAPHDVSIFNYLFDGCPVNVSARGHRCLDHQREDLAFAALEYPQSILANVHVSWLDPKKVRQITIVGDKKMVVWDDLDNIGPIKLYDKHVEKTTTFYETYGEFQLLSKEGSITIPKVRINEPLKTQNQYFIDCVTNNMAASLADGTKGRDVVKVLAAVQQSMDQKGTCIKLN